MRSRASVSNSGNSNVNMNVTIDTSPIAYSMACYLHASKMVTDEQFLHMLNNLNALLGKENMSLPPLLSNHTQKTHMNDIKTLKKFI
ncbi:hypothetical protein P6P90_00180 [Ectobacillus antri]|jgi:hypothetical protein|uniref:Uncharacterized protein n=1 Tax=Ectobacillus antri TaxID=2486280 RepID=A0ABT6GZK7_9BACI|nr:hypothetical protein [Ectobacillus antri]MDG4655741.1 hypothetical protein [Ectobacillus antri]MDG5752416.1 hypothetical protein [Ectobacillus antri]